MNEVVKVARLHLVDRYTYTWLVWGVLAFTLAVNIAIFALVPEGSSGNFTGAVLVVSIFLAIAGVLSMTRFLPFAFALGISRRKYFLGTVLLAAGLSAVNAVILTILRSFEITTGGWGIDVHFFRVPWLSSGSWSSALLTYFVVLLFSFLAGMWFGPVYGRFKLPGMLVTIGVIVLVVLAAFALIAWSNSWAAVGTYLRGLQVMGFVGVLAAVGAVILIAGYGTIRRVTA